MPIDSMSMGWAGIALSTRSTRARTAASRSRCSPQKRRPEAALIRGYLLKWLASAATWKPDQSRRCHDDPQLTSFRDPRAAFGGSAFAELGAKTQSAPCPATGAGFLAGGAHGAGRYLYLLRALVVRDAW